MLGAMVIAMLTAITVWWFLIRRLQEKPWAQQGVIPASQDSFTSSAPKVALWLFLAVVSSLFGLFASAYMMRMAGHGGLAAWQPVDEPGILWINTVVLVFASGALQIARNRTDTTDFGGVRGYFAAGGVLTVLFLVGQVLAWQQLHATGNYGPGNAAYSFFILLTAVHGLHLVGGLVVLARAARRIWRFDPADVVGRTNLRLSVQLCTLYWHWLLLIWLGLFALLLST